jgi:hypothetical protein
MVAAFAPAHPQLRELWESRIDDVCPVPARRRQPWVGTAMFVLGCLLSGIGVGATCANAPAPAALFAR